MLAERRRYNLRRLATLLSRCDQNRFLSKAGLRRLGSEASVPFTGMKNLFTEENFGNPFA
jgi:hypothetical protein